MLINCPRPFFGSKITNLLVFFVLSRKSVSGSRLLGVCMGRSGTSAYAGYAFFSHFCYVGGFGDLGDPMLPTLRRLHVLFGPVGLRRREGVRREALRGCNPRRSNAAAPSSVPKVAGRIAFALPEAGRSGGYLALAVTLTSSHHPATGSWIPPRLRPWGRWRSSQCGSARGSCSGPSELSRRARGLASCRCRLLPVQDYGLVQCCDLALHCRDGCGFGSGQGSRC